MGCAAKVIVFDDVRASQQRQALRQPLQRHSRFQCQVKRNVFSRKEGKVLVVIKTCLKILLGGWSAS